VRLVIPILDGELILRHIDASKAIVLEAGEVANASNNDYYLVVDGDWRLIIDG